ncbi:hypothetical protein LOD99_12437 [Oopsacas minuta]|uniref:Uncharacterized protein n=1 Tax=Oopsacas minuta TaxID=111878 RepID=A0AAV7JG90_9METZ|nr:hypothetical protein LOD99_12437 [Oopsacas minuta]
METIDTVIDLSILLNPEIVSINDNGFNHPNGHVKVEVKASMFDSKTLATMRGKGGAPCIACKATRSDLYSITNVVCGFPLDCSIEDIKETIRQLTSDGGELMSCNTNNGVGLHTHLQVALMFSCTTFTFNLRILDWFLNIIYRVAAGKSKSTEDQMVRDYRGLICKRIHELTNLLFDQPGSGNTSTGNMAEHFSYKKPCFRIALSFVPNVYRNTLTEIHRNLSVLLRVANSSEVVDVDRFRV